MIEVRLSSRARRDLAEILLYMIETNDTRAYSFNEGLAARVADIAERPLTFAPRDDFAMGLRAASYGTYLLVFRVVHDHVKIARIIHKSRDHRGMFK